MASRSRSHLSDASLRRSLAAHLAAENGACAELLADLAEMDARGLYRDDGYASLHDYCVGELHFTPGRAIKRVHVARKARRFPLILDLIAEGKLSLSGAMLLAARLTEDNARELLADAAGKTVAGIELLLAHRFPKPDEPTRIAVIPTPQSFVCRGEVPAHSLEPDSSGAAPGLSTWKVEFPQVVGNPEPASSDADGEGLAPGTGTHASAPDVTAAATPALSTWKVPALPEPSRVKPLAPERYSLKTTIDQAAHDDLRRAQDLLRGGVASGDVGEVLKRALRLLVQDLEKRKFAVTERPGKPASKPSQNPRYIPSAVKRAVHERDGGQCTFVGENGHRCEANGASLEYDHVIPIARGGTSTTSNLRLRCRAHNQLEAERVLGAEFMRHQREAAMERRLAVAAP